MHAGMPDPPGADTPPDQVHPLGADLPWSRPPGSRPPPPRSRHTPLGADTPLTHQAHTPGPGTPPGSRRQRMGR